MDSKHIDELLNKYWNCETSLEEEAQLRQYFSATEVPDHLREAANLFRYFENSRKNTITDIAFERNIIAHANGPGRGKSVSLVRNSMRIAAGIAVLAVAGWFVRDEIWNSAQEDTFDNPEVAYEETKKALLLISRTFNAAEEKAKKVKLFNDAQEEIQGKDDDAKL